MTHAPYSMQSARFLARAKQAQRAERKVGRFGITETEKHPGDYVWNGLRQQFERL